MNIDYKYWLLKLGWSSTDNGKTWHRGNATMTAQDAMDFELSRLVAFHRSCFTCPDCGYDVMSAEFIDEEFHKFLHEQDEEKKAQFYSDGTTRVERHTLVREGFPNLELRKIHGKWQMLAYTNSRLDYRWMDLNLPEETILEQIDLYGES